MQTLRGVSCEAQVNSMCAASSACSGLTLCLGWADPEAMMLGICGLPAESMQAFPAFPLGLGLAPSISLSS